MKMSTGQQPDLGITTQGLLGCKNSRATSRHSPCKSWALTFGEGSFLTMSLTTVHCRFRYCISMLDAEPWSWSYHSSTSAKLWPAARCRPFPRPRRPERQPGTASIDRSAEATTSERCRLTPRSEPTCGTVRPFRSPGIRLHQLVGRSQVHAWSQQYPGLAIFETQRKWAVEILSIPVRCWSSLRTHPYSARRDESVGCNSRVYPLPSLAQHDR